MRLAKEHNITIFIVGHVTKEGTVAGPTCVGTHGGHGTCILKVTGMHPIESYEV